MIFITLIISYTSVYATGNTKSDDNIKVLLNEEELKFDVSPQIIKGSVMVPMRQIFEYLGAQVDWKPNTQNVIGYRRYKNSSNIFIKLGIGDEYAYNNGRNSKLLSPPVIIDGRTLVPVRFISESFGLKVDWDEDNKSVLLTYDGNLSEGKKTLDYTEYKPRFFDHGVKIMIPDYWNKLDTENSFGFTDEFENIQMDVFDIAMDTPLPLEYIMEEYKFILGSQYKDAVTIIDSRIDNINNIDVARIDTEVVISEIKEDQTHIFFLANNNIYRVTFKYNKDDEYNYYNDIIKNIISTIEISSKTFNTSDEHYIEYDGFFNNKLELKSPIYANQLVENSFEFTGSIDPESTVTELKAIVLKGDSKKEFTIPLVDNKFKSTIYTPYGLGKHNIIIKAVVEDGYEKIMQFSVVNMSIADITYIMPSTYVNIVDEDTVTTARLLTEDIAQERDRAFAIFEFMAKNINNEPIQNESIRNSAKVLDDKSGSPKELAYLYAAMLRSINIPCKIYAGISDDGVHYWNQVQVNGSWILVDVTRVGAVLDEDGYFKEIDLDYFDKDKINYIEEFYEISELNE